MNFVDQKTTADQKTTPDKSSSAQPGAQETADSCPLVPPEQLQNRAQKPVTASMVDDGPARPTLDFDHFVRHEDGLNHLALTVPDIHCAACIQRIETALTALPGVVRARVNMSTRRVQVSWRDEDDGEEAAGSNRLTGQQIADRIMRLGFDVLPFEDGAAGQARDHYGRDLLIALALAGFAAGNIMLLSIAVWSGATGATRDLFHWISAMIALPVIIISGRPFYRSAFKALKNGQLNMDVPISLAVVLAGGMSLFETVQRGHTAYFDAAVTLLFFLLIGRYLDHMMRDRTRSAVARLLKLTPETVTQLHADGSRARLPVSEVQPGMVLLVAAGDRIPVDGVVVSGRSTLDCAHITGEALPETVAPGDKVLAGAANLAAPLRMRALKPAAESFVADMVRLMEAAEQGKASYMRLADRAARIYAPAVHLLAALAFLGWYFYSGDWHLAVFIAISVLIITCPCALGLAVPAVQVTASGLLFQNGVLVKDGAALEKLAGIDSAVFDKTGTLTLGRPELIADPAVPDEALAIAAGLAGESRHPLARALYNAARRKGMAVSELEGVQEVAGSGLSGMYKGALVRLGEKHWVERGEPRTAPAADIDDVPALDGKLKVWLKIGDQPPVRFMFEDRLRPDAAEMIGYLKLQGIAVAILSGDKPGPVAVIAHKLGITRYYAGQTPADKLTVLETMADRGQHVLMVGDGLNDAPALAAGYVSIAPAAASDVGRAAADFVFLGDSLKAINRAVRVARLSRRLVWQNFSLAIGYNLIAVPLAMLGYATPLVAAIAMSSSSLLVTLNALRLRWHKI